MQTNLRTFITSVTSKATQFLEEINFVCVSMLYNLMMKTDNAMKPVNLCL